MGKIRKSITSVIGVRMTATVSVALVLFVLGIMALVGVAAHRVVHNIRESTGFLMVMDENATKGSIDSLTSRIKSAPYTANYTYSSPDEVLARWRELLGEDEDPLLLAGENPFTAEFEVHVKSQYASVDSLERITQSLSLLNGVEEVTINSEQTTTVNTFTGDIVIILAVVALSLLLISVALINNTVSLSMYNHRFTIHTMRLVGATDAFIRRPFVRRHVISGAIAGLIAGGVITGLTIYLSALEPIAAYMARWEVLVPLCAGLVVAGMLLCASTAYWATRRYLRMDYDSLFK